MNRIEQPYSKPRIALKLKIDLNDKLVKKLGIKKSDLFCHVEQLLLMLGILTVVVRDI